MRSLFIWRDMVGDVAVERTRFHAKLVTTVVFTQMKRVRQIAVQKLRASP